MRNLETLYGSGVASPKNGVRKFFFACEQEKVTIVYIYMVHPLVNSFALISREV